jgi:hypothetical protein
MYVCVRTLPTHIRMKYCVYIGVFCGHSKSMYTKNAYALINVHAWINVYVLILVHNVHVLINVYVLEPMHTCVLTAYIHTNTPTTTETRQRK